MKHISEMSQNVDEASKRINEYIATEVERRFAAALPPGGDWAKWRVDVDNRVREYTDKIDALKRENQELKDKIEYISDIASGDRQIGFSAPLERAFDWRERR